MDLALLKEVAFFEGLTAGQLGKIASIGELRAYPAGAFLFSEGDEGDDMFVVMRGKVRISKQVPGIGEEALAILEAGQTFGEMAIVEDSPRSADAIAHSSCEVLVFTRRRLDELMFTDKDLAYVLLWGFVHTLSARLRETSDKLKSFFAISRFE